MKSLALRNLGSVASNRTIGCRVLLSALVFAVVAACGASEGPVRVSDTPLPEITSPAADPATIGANELGLVPVLMYHQLSSSPASEYDQTPEKFRGELERLHGEGYRPVTAADYISGHIDLPAGTHPVVLTFDDSTMSQLRFTDDGKVVPDSVIGILEDFGTRNPDFKPTATFYVNNEPFGNDRRALSWLAAHGYEIGAHTANHANLARLDSTGVQRELVENLRAIESMASGHHVHTMALPLGIFPADHILATEGSWDGTTYKFDAAMLVGAEPAPSPFAKIEPSAVPRIRSGRGEVDFDSTYWLTWLAAHPDQRYTSDGNPNTVSFPKSLSGELISPRSHQSNPY
jgi:hypothetical protein